MIHAAIALGAFYIFAGFVVMRAMALDRVMDQVLAALNDPCSGVELQRTRVLTVGAVLTLASGVALAVLSPMAPIVFGANAIWQGGYLLWAERALPPEDEGEARGRQKTKNAFVIYLAVTAFVLWLGLNGHLRPWDVSMSSLAIDVALMIAATGLTWGFIHLPRQKSSLQSVVGQDDGFSSHSDEPVPARLRLSPSWNRSPLWNADTDSPVSVYVLGLPFELAERIEAWDDRWQATYNEYDPAAGGFKTENERQAYVDEGRAIVQALQSEWSGELDVDEILSG